MAIGGASIAGVAPIVIKTSLTSATLTAAAIRGLYAGVPGSVGIGTTSISGLAPRVTGNTSGGGSSTTTFDPANKASSITLSNGNLTAQNTGLLGNNLVRSIASHTTGKFYCEATVGGVLNGANSAVGFCDSTESMTTQLGSDIDGVGYQKGGVVLFNNATASTIQTYTTTNIIGMAIDIGGSLVWFQVNGGNWNNNASNNPATGVGGISISGIGGTLFVCVECHASSDSFTMNFGASAYSNAAPPGFSNW